MAALAAPVLSRDRDGGADPLHAQLKRILKQQILDSAYRAGQQLPTEAQLVEFYKVSRTTVRRTLAELTQERFIERRPGVGTTVRPRLYWDRRSSRMFGFYEEMRAQGLEAHAEIVSVAHGRATSADAVPLDVGEGARVMRIRQLGFVDDQPLAIADLTLRLPAGAVLAASELLGRRSVYPYLDKIGLRFDAGHKVVSAEAASAEDAVLLGVAPGSPLLVAEITARAERPVGGMFIRTRYRGDRYRYAVEVHT